MTRLSRIAVCFALALVASACNALSTAQVAATQQLLVSHLSFFRDLHNRVQGHGMKVLQAGGIPAGAIPPDCAPIMTFVMTQSAITPSPSGTVTLPSLKTVCDLWGPLQSCYGALQSAPQFKDMVPSGLIAAIQPLQSALCGSQDGTACYTIADAILGVATCEGSKAPNCPSGCVAPVIPTTPAPLPGQQGSQAMVSYSKSCQPALNSALLENVCHSCLLNIVKGLLQSAVAIQALDLAKTGIKPDQMFGDMDTNSMMAMLQTVRDTVCSSVPSTGTRCLVQLGVVSSSSSAQAQSMIFGDGANSAIPNFQNSMVNKICSDASNQICFGKVATGMLSISAMDANQNYKSCMKSSMGSSTSQMYCTTSLKQKKAEMAANALQVSTMCLKNGAGQICLGLPDAAKNAAGSQWDQCAWYFFSTYSMSDACVNYMNTTVSSWGCCQKFIFALAVDSNAKDGNSVNNVINPRMRPLLAAMPPMCQIQWAAPIKKSLKLNVPFAKLQANQTLYWQTINSSRMDVANRIGVSPDNIVNATLTSTSTLGRFFSVLQSTGSSNFNFAIQTQDAAVATAASSNFDADVSKGTMYLPTTSLALQQDGVLTAGAAVGDSFTGGSSSSGSTGGNTGSSSSNLPIIIGVVVGAVVLVAIIAAVVMMNGKKQPQQDNYVHMTGSRA